MQIERPQTKHRDDRGEIIDLLVKEPVEYVTLIRSVKGAVRGNHFHKETLQWIYLIDGKLRVLSRMPGEEVRVDEIEPGQVFLNDLLEHHAVEALEDSTFMVFTRGPRGADDYERDTYRLETPLRAPE